MNSAGRKRVVSSCIPCYTRKQKCNRRYPCDHCTRRRLPEECAYYPAQASQASSRASQVPISPLQGEYCRNSVVSADHNGQSLYASSTETVGALLDWNTKNTAPSQGSKSLAKWFGYAEDSECNTLALVRKLGLEDESQDGVTQAIPPETSEEIENYIRKVPDRQILDFLIQYYVTDVHWMEQLVHPPWFLRQYQQWWTLRPISSVWDVEFGVLVLRICSYASQFLPSPSCTIDKIRGMSLGDIRETCNDIGERLTLICARLDAKGSLVRVQHLSFSGLRLQCEGRIDAFWETLNTALRIAQKIGLHRGNMASILGMHELENEMRRRVFCNLYIWDSLLSRQLDRTPFLPTTLAAENFPHMHLAPNSDDTNAPEGYSERLLQAHLANFWRNFDPRQGTEYDATVAEERYEKFCADFLAMLPPTFALEPNEEWDNQLQKIPLQRQILHIAIFDSLCYNFRPVLLQESNHVQSLPTYKQVLLSSQRKALAVAALKVLESTSNLHSMMGGSHVRLAGIIYHTFEAAVLLIGLCMDATFPGQDGDGPPSTRNGDPLGSGKSQVTRSRCSKAVHDALERLRTLAEVSDMADVGAHTLTRLISNTPHLQVPSAESMRSGIMQIPNASSSAGHWPSLEAPDLQLSALNDYMVPPSEITLPSWDILIAGLDSSLDNHR